MTELNEWRELALDLIKKHYSTEEIAGFVPNLLSLLARERDKVLVLKQELNKIQKEKESK